MGDDIAALAFKAQLNSVVYLFQRRSSRGRKEPQALKVATCIPNQKAGHDVVGRVSGHLEMV